MESEFRCERLGIMGAGRVAQALLLKLAPFSRSAPLLYGRSPEKVERALSHGPRARAAHPGDILAACDIIIIAVSDDAIDDFVASLVHIPLPLSAPFIFHVSGRCGASILDPLRQAGALTAAIHPVMTFTGDPLTEARRMTGASFAVTGSTPEATARAHAVVHGLDGKALEIDENKRSLYHAALSHAANHLVTLLAGSARALEVAGVGEPYGVMAPLVRAVLENSLANGFGALSGPLLRGDVGTVTGHLAAFEQHDLDMAAEYRAMALATVRELEKSKPAMAGALTALRDVLGKDASHATTGNGPDQRQKPPSPQAPDL